MSDVERKEAAERLQQNWQRSTDLFRKQTDTCDANSRASYEFAGILAVNMKPLTDGEIVKDCVLAVMECVCPEKQVVATSVSLSARTVARRVEELSDDLRGSLNVCDAALKCAAEMGLDLSRLVAVTTDGAPAMVGQKKGAASLIVQKKGAASLIIVRMPATISPS